MSFSGSLQTDLMDEEACHESAVYLTEALEELDVGASIMDRLSADELAQVRSAAIQKTLKSGEAVFFQGDAHNGIWFIESGVIRTYYAAASGREITLALWTSGHFVGGPEIFGGGAHIWSAKVQEDACVFFLPGAGIKRLIETIPTFAICIIEGLVAKGKCYSALVQMLGTRSVTERLAHLLIIFADTYGRHDGNRLLIDKKITHDQLASIVGSTRQWVTMTLDKFQKKGMISVSRQQIVIEQYDMLRGLTD